MEHKSFSPPPRWLDILMEHFCAPDLLEEVIGDLHERYYLRAHKFGESNARKHYWREVIAYLRPDVYKSNSSQNNKPVLTDMIRNYLKIAYRNLVRHKTFSFINITGLTIALTCCLLIFLYVSDELSYDRYNLKADRIYRVTRDFLSPDGTINLHLGHVAPPFGPLLKNDFPEFEQVARTFENRILTTWQNGQSQQKSMYVDRTYIAESSLFKIFTINIIEGNPLKNFYEPFKAILAKSTAEKIFGDDDPLGKRLTVENAWEVQVTGVYTDFPKESFWHPKMFISFATLNNPQIYGREGLERNWGNNSFGTFILVHKPFDADKVTSRFPDFIDRHMGPDLGGENVPKPSTWTRLYLQKMTDIHLYSHLDSEEEANGSITNVYMIGVIGLFILLIACFNFINLSTARATKRSKEVGIRKVAGAYKRQLIIQFISESVLIALLAMVLNGVVLIPALKWLNDFTNKNLHVMSLSNWHLILGVVLFAIAIGVMAGFYPAFIMSGFKPVTVIKGQQSIGRRMGSLRKVLVVIQFALSIMLIIATVVTYQQLNYLNKSELGYDKDQVITLPYYGELAKNYEVFYNDMTSQSFIKDVARSSRIPTGRLLDSQGSGNVQMGDSIIKSSVTIKNIRCDYDFFNTYSIPLAAGRNFSKDIKSDDSLAFILNETAVSMLGLSNDEIINREFEYGNTKGKIIGVVQDFHFESLKEPIVPVVFKPSRDYNRVSVKIAGNDMQQAIKYIENEWREVVPDYPFEYEFLSERYRNLYESEQRQGELFTIFSGLAILIACLGLFGLATFNTLQRVREIGIRKILGASIPNILSLLSRELIFLVFTANLIAWPVVWYAMNQWLENFAYRIRIHVEFFIIAGVFTLVLALLTISYQTLKAALSNPVEAIHNE